MMKTQFTSNSARFIAFLFVSAIIIGFVFTFDQGQGGGFLSRATNVADVDGTPITLQEFRNGVAQNAKRYAQLFGGKELSPKQLEQFGIPRTTLQTLIEKKAMFNASTEIGFLASTEEIKEEIKQAPFFQTEGKFDVNKYKQLLQYNGLTPTGFEDTVREDVQVRKLEKIFSTNPVSKGLAKDIAKFKNDAVELDAVRVERSLLQEYLPISSSEVSKYIQDKNNEPALKGAYERKKSTYSKPEQVKGYHILIQGQDKKAETKIKGIRKTLNKSNFKKIASKVTEDPSGKGNEGTLGWFSKGRMVPEFEKVAFSMKKGEISQPVKTQFGYHIIYVEDKKAASTKTFNQVKKELARENIRRTKTKELTEFMKKTAKSIENSLKAGSRKAAEKTAKKYGLSFYKDQKLNALESKIASYQLDPERFKKVFNSKNKVLTIEEPTYIWVIKTRSPKGKPDFKKLTEAEISTQASNYSRKSRSEFLKNITERASIDCMSDFRDLSYCQ
jgi:peptidyl-prolyl cis-trans isomerase D